MGAAPILRLAWCQWRYSSILACCWRSAGYQWSGNLCLHTRYFIIAALCTGNLMDWANDVETRTHKQNKSSPIKKLESVVVNCRHCPSCTNFRKLFICLVLHCKRKSQWNHYALWIARYKHKIEWLHCSSSNLDCLLFAILMSLGSNGILLAWHKRRTALQGWENASKNNFRPDIFRSKSI